MSLSPIVAVHATAAIGAVVTGPVALWARKGAKQRPKLHRAFGYAWVTLMVIAAVSAMFIRDFRPGMPNIAGFTLIHLFVPATFIGLFGAFYYLAQGNIAKHRETMQRLYFGACLVAGFFALAPQRIIGHYLWSQLGLI
jgi:uncharacterized membrane protein